MPEKKVGWWDPLFRIVGRVVDTLRGKPPEIEIVKRESKIPQEERIAAKPKARGQMIAKEEKRERESRSRTSRLVDEEQRVREYKKAQRARPPEPAPEAPVSEEPQMAPEMIDTRIAPEAAPPKLAAKPKKPKLSKRVEKALPKSYVAAEQPDTYTPEQIAARRRLEKYNLKKRAKLIAEINKIDADMEKPTDVLAAKQFERERRAHVKEAMPYMKKKVAKRMKQFEKETGRRPKGAEIEQITAEEAAQIQIVTYYYAKLGGYLVSPRMGSVGQAVEFINTPMRMSRGEVEEDINAYADFFMDPASVSVERLSTTDKLA